MGQFVAACEGVFPADDLRLGEASIVKDFEESLGATGQVAVCPRPGDMADLGVPTINQVVSGHRPARHIVCQYRGKTPMNRTAVQQHDGYAGSPQLILLSNAERRN